METLMQTGVLFVLIFQGVAWTQQQTPTSAEKFQIQVVVGSFLAAPYTMDYPETTELVIHTQERDDFSKLHPIANALSKRITESRKSTNPDDLRMKSARGLSRIELSLGPCSGQQVVAPLYSMTMYGISGGESTFWLCVSREKSKNIDINAVLDEALTMDPLKRDPPNTPMERANNLLPKRR